MGNKLEVEGKEILIKSSKGIMAVIPKDKVSWVKEQIESGRNDVVDKYVGSLKEFKYDNQKAANGLYANIHAKRARIEAGSGERMRKPGEAGAPTADQFKQAAKTAKAEDGVRITPPVKEMAADATKVNVQVPSMDKVKVETEKFKIIPISPLMPFNYYQEKRKKEKQKAENGVVINPPTKAIASDATRTTSIVPNVIYPREDLVRRDGTMKDVGFLGVQKSPSGFDVTEYSIGVPVNGKIIDAPTLVPTLSQEEIKYVIDKADKGEDLGRDPIGNSIYKKAAQHAKQRVMKGLSPFYSSVIDEAAAPTASDATKVNRFPVNPDTDARKPIVQTQPLKTYMVRGIKEAGDLLGVKTLKKGGHPNETYSDVVYRLSHTPRTLANRMEKEYPKGLSILAGAGEALLDPVNALPLGSWAGSGLKYLGANAGNIPKLAATLFRMGKAAPFADFITTANDAKVANDEYLKRPEPENKPLTKEEQDLINRITKNINQQKIVR
jgi:hypothetical protein